MISTPSRKAGKSSRVLLSETKSVCPICLERIDARYTAGADGVFLEKDCPDHGSFCVFVWDTPLGFLKWKTRVFDEPDFRSDCPYGCGICEYHLQETCCVLIELTQRCNLGCPICFASSGGGDVVDDPDLTTIAGWYDMLMENGGPFNIQLSGGEPTMRDDLPEIIHLGREKGFRFSSLIRMVCGLPTRLDILKSLKKRDFQQCFCNLTAFPIKRTSRSEGAAS